MKAMIISDIHGDIDKLNTCLDIFNKEKCDKLFILGDLFNYGIDYHKFEIIEKLNMYCGIIIAVRGNCDINVDGINFEMPTVNKCKFNNYNIALSHGDLYTKEDFLEEDYDIIMLGHSHVSKIEIINDKLILNPGSISKSRKGDNSFIIIDNDKVSIRNLNNSIIEEYII